MNKRKTKEKKEERRNYEEKNDIWLQLLQPIRRPSFFC